MELRPPPKIKPPPAGYFVPVGATDAVWVDSDSEASAADLPDFGPEHWVTAPQANLGRDTQSGSPRLFVSASVPERAEEVWFSFFKGTCNARHSSWRSALGVHHVS